MPSFLPGQGFKAYIYNSQVDSSADCTFVHVCRSKTPIHVGLLDAWNNFIDRGCPRGFLLTRTAKVDICRTMSEGRIRFTQVPR